MKKLDDIYAQSGILTRTKAPQLRFVLIVILSLLPFAAINDLVTKDFVSSAIELVIIAVMGFSLGMLYRGKYRLASVLPLVFAVIGTVGLSILTDIESEFQVYAITLYMMITIVLSIAISTTEWSTLVVSAIGAATIVGVSLLKIHPALRSLGSSGVVEQLVIGMVIYLLSSAFAFHVARSNRIAMQGLERAYGLNERRITQIAEVGRQSARTADSAHSIANDYAEVNRNMDMIRTQVEVYAESTERLRRNIAKALEAVASTAEKAKGFHKQVDDQNVVVQESTSSVNEMSASLDSVASITAGKQQSSERLLRVVDEGRGALEQTNRSISEATEQMNSLLEINDIISDIAAQTNLLSMNAAIEAAHAGDQGRGFAVVAEEIRKLATSTSENSQIIAENLKRIRSSIGNTGELAARTSAAMDQISTEVKEVAEAFREITGSTAELSMGGKEIMSAMLALQDSSIAVRDGSDQISRDQQNAKDEMDQFGAVVQAIENASAEVINAVDKIGSSIDNLNATILESGKASDSLQDSIAKLTE